jgi:hypothetical protein
MDVVWQDNVPSFLDGSTSGIGGFAASLGDVGAPWFASADGGVFSGKPVLWWENGADAASVVSRLSNLAGFNAGGASSSWIPDGADAFLGGAPTLDGALLWPQGRDGTSMSLLTGTGAGQFELSAVDVASS